jgi:hypothetical protein
MIHTFSRSIPQTHQEQWLIYRKVIQAWTESIANVAAKDLQPAEVEALESAVLRSNRAWTRRFAACWPDDLAHSI